MAAATAVPTFSMHVFVPALPAAAAALDASPAQIQLTVTLYLIGLALGQMVHGPISDRFGRRPVILSGLAVYLFGTLGALLSPTLIFLLVSRGLQSVGSCAGLVVGRAIIRETTAGNGAAAGLAVLASVITLSSAVAPLAGTYLNLWLGWRMIFAVLLVTVLIITGVLYLRLPETNHAPSASLSLAGMARGFGRLIAMPEFLGYSLCGASATVTAYGFYTALPFLVAEELPGSAHSIGLIYVAVVAGSILGALTARVATRSMSLNRIAFVGTSCSVLAAIAFLIGREMAPGSVLTIIIPLFVMTYAGGFANPGASTQAMSVDRDAIGAASSLYGAIQMAVGASLTLLVGLVGHNSLPVGLITLGSVAVGFAGLCLARYAQRTRQT